VSLEPLPFKTTRRVEFRDTDAAGIVHFSAFFVYMEQAEHELLRHLGLGVVLNDDDGDISWPRISATCDFRSPARFEDVLEIEVVVTRISRKTVTYSFRFTRDDESIANGAVTTVCCRIETGCPPRAITIPEWIAEKLRQGMSQEVEESKGRNVKKSGG
jgi:4-hydroxybenzoyl-CoA thioesterase/acyl-CoA thioester hydrolase